MCERFGDAMILCSKQLSLGVCLWPVGGVFWRWNTHFHVNSLLNWTKFHNVEDTVCSA